MEKDHNNNNVLLEDPKKSRFPLEMEAKIIPTDDVIVCICSKSQKSLQCSNVKKNKHQHHCGVPLRRWTASKESEDEFCWIDSPRVVQLWERVRETRGLGIVFALASVMCWSSNSLCYKLASDRIEPMALLTISSFSVSLIYLCVIVCIYKRPVAASTASSSSSSPSSASSIELASSKSMSCTTIQKSSSSSQDANHFDWRILLGPPDERWHLLSRCLLGTISMASLYSSLKYIPMADATTIRFTSPVFIAIFAHFLVDEPFGALQAVNCFTTLAGVILIGRPSFLFDAFGATPEEYSSNSPQLPVLESQKIEGFVLALISALTISMSMISMRKLHSTPAALVIFWFSLLSAIFGAVSLFVMGEWSNLNLSLPMLAFLVATTIGSSLDQLFITMALKLESAGAVAVIQALCVLFSFFLSITVVGEQVHSTSAIGGALIFLSVVILAGAKWLREIEAYSMFGSRSSLNSTESTSTSTSTVKPIEEGGHFEKNLNTYVSSSKNMVKNIHDAQSISGVEIKIDSEPQK